MALKLPLACILVWGATLLAGEAPETAPEAGPYANPPAPQYRVDARGFDGAGADDIKAVCDSAAREIWRFFPDCKIEPFVIVRSHKGPRVLYRRNQNGEIVMWLDTHSTYWCQYAYQFSHELCHILCGYDEDHPANKWFEETLCEMASLFAMRAMARAWETDPPYQHWKGYRKAIAEYVANVIDKRPKLTKKSLKAFYVAHRNELRAEPNLRKLNGAMAVVLLEIFETQPQHWPAVRWLNSSPSKPGRTFREYLQDWHDAAPQRHEEFIRKIARLYGVTLKAKPAAAEKAAID